MIREINAVWDCMYCGAHAVYPAMKRVMIAAPEQFAGYIAMDCLEIDEGPWVWGSPEEALRSTSAQQPRQE